jgi:hypothetical protein
MGQLILKRVALTIAVTLCIAAATAVLGSRNAATADTRRPAPWCAYLGGESGGYDCGYYTFEQCMETARGLGNYCVPNPWAPPPPRGTRT